MMAVGFTAVGQFGYSGNIITKAVFLPINKPLNIMTETVFCPNCHRKNDAAATVCSYCGSLLASSKSSIQTTANVPTSAESVLAVSPCAGKEIDVPSGGIVLLVEGHPEPIVKESGSSFILGRYGQTAVKSSSLVDLMDLGAMELGVSRNHARISYEDNLFVIEDLDSTNGSWLNNMQLHPGRRYPLQNNDRLMLGKLLLWVCLAERPFRTISTFSLELAAAAERVVFLSLEVLQTAVLPYLEALSGMQRVLDELAERPFTPPTILSIQVAATNEITIKAGSLADAVGATVDRIIPWRNLHLDLIGTPATAVDPSVYQSLVRLSATVLADRDPDLTSTEKFTAVEKLTPHLLILAFSPLTLST